MQWGESDVSRGLKASGGGVIAGSDSLKLLDLGEIVFDWKVLPVYAGIVGGARGGIFASGLEPAAHGASVA